MIIDATNRVVGRLASVTAKKLLEGNEIIIVNAGDAIVTGKPAVVKARYEHKVERGDRRKGPFIHRLPEGILTRAVRGMLPRTKPKGRAALKRLKIFQNCPEDYKNSETYGKDITEIRCKYIKLKDLSKFLGAKVGE